MISSACLTVLSTYFLSVDRSSIVVVANRCTIVERERGHLHTVRAGAHSFDCVFYLGLRSVRALNE